MGQTGTTSRGWLDPNIVSCSQPSLSSPVCLETKSSTSPLLLLLSADYHHQSSMSNSDFGELVWENGQIVIKGGHFSKVSRVGNMDSFVNSKTGRPGTSLGFDEAVGGYSGADVIPWFYHLDDELHHESASGLVAEASGVTSNGFPSFANFSAAGKLSNPVMDSRVSGVGGNGVSNYVKESVSLMDQLSEMRLQKKEDKQVQAENFNLYRHVARAKSDSESVGPRASVRLLTHEIAATNDGTAVDANASGQTTDASRKCLLGGPVEKQADAMLAEDGLKVNTVNGANAQIEFNDGHRKIREPTAAPPSLCSENSGLRASNNPTYFLKRKHSDEEDCESSSADDEEESISIRKTGCKRNRAAEVHNFNERKRREKINEKICALQDLIPNCNKVDKATMLDKAIEYLRVLQFQVQMMSMRSHMCPSPMMAQPGLQHLHAQTHLQQFVPMAFGMGMGYQAQAGLLDTSPGFPTYAAFFPGSSNPHPQLWNAAQGLPMSMSQMPGLSVPVPGAPMTLPRSAAENPNSKDPHLQ